MTDWSNHQLIERSIDGSLRSIDRSNVTTTGTCTSDRVYLRLKVSAGVRPDVRPSLTADVRTDVRAAERLAGRPAGRSSAALVSSAAPKKKTFDRGGPVWPGNWPPRSNVTNDRLRGGSGGALPPQPKIGGSGGQRPPAKIFVGP